MLLLERRAIKQEEDFINAIPVVIDHKLFINFSIEAECVYTWNALMERTIPLELGNLFVMN